MNNIDKDIFHDALHEVILDIDSRMEKKAESIKNDVSAVEKKLDKLTDILEKLV